MAAAVPLYRNRRVRGFFQRVFVYLLFALCLVFFAAGLHGLPALSLYGRLLAGWGGGAFGAVYPFAMAAGLSWPALAALALAVPGVAAVERFAARGKGGTVAHWIRRRGWFVRWPLYWLLVAGLLLLGVYGPVAPVYQLF
jgi:hypothetical protein